VLDHRFGGGCRRNVVTLSALRRDGKGFAPLAGPTQRQLVEIAELEGKEP
jgi:hypothetical protein